MKKLAVLSLLLGATTLFGAEVSHRFIAHGYTEGKAFVVAADGSVEREICDLHGVQDSWTLENGNIIFSHVHGIKEIAPDNSVVWEYTCPEGVELHSVQLLENGNVLAAEGGTNRLIEINRQTSEIVKEIPVEGHETAHRQFRTVRKTSRGTYWVIFAGASKAKEVDETGAVLREIVLGEGIHKAHGIDLLPNGNVLISTANDHEVKEFDLNGNVVWSLSLQDLKKAGVKKIKYMAAIKRLENGNTFVSMYRGNPQFFEITPDKKMVWKYYNESFGKIVGFQLLD